MNKNNKLLKGIAGIVVLLCLAASSNVVFGYDPTANNYVPYDFGGAWVPNYNGAALIYPGTINTNTLVMATFLGLNPSAGPVPASSYGDGGATTPHPWDDQSPNLQFGDGIANGHYLDGLWVQLRWTAATHEVGYWHLPFPARYVVVFESLDHEPYLGEGLEYRLYGYFPGHIGAPLATLVCVYLDGWLPHMPHSTAPPGDSNDNGWCSDDIAAMFDLGALYPCVEISAWDQQGVTTDYWEPEIDAVAARAPMAVGGTMVLVDKSELSAPYSSAPYIGLASTIVVAMVATSVYAKRVKRREEK